MLKFFRGIANSWVGPVIMGTIFVAFGLLGGGMRNLVTGRIENAVVQAGSHQVTAAEFTKMWNNKKQDYEQQTSQTFPVEELVKQGGDKSMVQDLAQQTAYMEMISRFGIRPSDDVVATALRKQAESGSSALSQVFDPVTGKFNPKAMEGFLQQNGLTMAQFQRSFADDIASQEFGSAMQAGFSLPRIYAAVQASLLLESRDVTYFVIPAASAPRPTPPTDAQLTAMIQQYRDKLMLPERRVLTIVRFSAKAIAPTMPVDPTQVQQQFDAKKASYGKPETRSLVEIPLNNPGDAAAVGAALAKGQDPNAIAKSIGVTPIVYADQPLAAIADVKAGAAAFAMKEGDVSGPVQGDFKTVILKVTKVTPGQAPDINAARAQITAQLQEAAAEDKVYTQSQAFEDAVQGGASVADAAAKVGATAVTVGPVSADGKDLSDPQPNPILSPKLLKSAFDQAQGTPSDIEQDADKGELYVVQVDKVIPPNPPGLNEKGVRDILTGAYYQQAMVTWLQKRAADAQAALHKGQSFETVAGAMGGSVAHQVGLQRISAQQYQAALGQDFLQQVFQSKAGALFTAGSDPLKGFVIARVDAIHPADPKQVATILDAVRQRGGEGYLDAVATTLKALAMQSVKPSIDLDLARQAMGIDKAMVERNTPKLLPGAGKTAGLAR